MAKYTDEMLIEEAKRLYKENGFLTSKLINEKSLYCSSTFVKRFGSVENVCVKLGLSDTKILNNKEYKKYIEEFKNDNKNIVKNNKCRKVFINNLPLTGRYINWKNSIGYKIHFIYDDKEGDFLIKGYNSKKDKGTLIIEYKNKEFECKTGDMLESKISKIVNFDEDLFHYKIGEIITNKNGSIQVIDRLFIPKTTQSGRVKYIKYKCLDCGNVDKIYESNLKKGYGCPKCAKIKKRKRYVEEKYKEVKKYIESLGMELLSKEYKGTHDNLKVRCKCGNIFERTLSIFKGTQNRKGIHECPKCHGITVNTYESVKENLHNHKIELISDTYKNNSSKLKIKYSECGHEMERRYSDIIKNYKCPKCNRKGYGRDTEQLRKEIKEMTGGEYELLSEYKNSITKVKIRHNKCGTIYETTSHNFLDNNCRCPKCSMSKGENMFKKLLMRNNIKFE